MGQRANYFLIKDNRITIYYHHWRALNITQDLFLGEKTFLRFVKDCRIEETFLDEPWIEGCVIINLNEKKLWFWTDHFYPSSVDARYFSELNTKWIGWDIKYLFDRSSDVEKILDIEYPGKHDVYKLDSHTHEEVINDEPGRWIRLVIAIKTSNGTKVIPSDLDAEGVLNFGEAILPLLLGKPTYQFPNEGDDIVECLVIDILDKKIFYSSNQFNLWEQVHHKWPGYSFQMSTWGYIKTLQMANIPTDGLIMSDQKAEEKFLELTKQTDPTNILDLVAEIKKEDPDAWFNPDIFDDAKPEQTFVDKLKAYFKRN